MRTQRTPTDQAQAFHQGDVAFHQGEAEPATALLREPIEGFYAGRLA